MKVRTISFGNKATSRGGLWCRLGLTLFLAQQGFTSAQAGGTVLAWGYDNAGQSHVPPGLNNAIAIAAGSSHSLALKSDGTVAAWGWSQFGQTNVPPGLTGVVAVSAGDLFSMALKSNGTVVTWGNIIGAPAGATNGVRTIAAGWDHCLVVKSNGTVLSWGSQNVVPEGLNNVLAVAAGNGHSLALRADGTVVAWGDPSYSKTVVPASATDVVAIAAGRDHCLALKRNGTVVAWGRNSSNQATVPAGLTNVAAIAAGGYHSLAVRVDGSYTAWGDSTYNQSFVNVNVSGLMGVAAGAYHSLVIQGNGSPAFTVQPVSQILVLGQKAFFQAVTVGVQPMGYQWRKNGFDIPGANSPTFVIPSVVLEDAGTYTLVATNSLASVLSQPAILTTVASGPWIVSQPPSGTKPCGDTAPLVVVADGPQPLAYQWLREGTNLVGATQSSLPFSGFSTADIGGYSVIITNIYGAVTSTVAQLTVSDVPVITAQPTNIITYCGLNPSLQVVVSGAVSLTYQWFQDGNPVPGATSPTLTLTNVVSSNAGDYFVIVSSACGVSTSLVATVTVLGVPVITTQPKDTNAYCGEVASFRASATGPAPLSYQWLLKGEPIVNATTTVLTVNPVTTEQAGDYSLVVSSPCGSITSSVAQLHVVVEAPFITSVLTASTAQGLPFSYQITALHRPSTFSAAYLPPGLSLNPLTGLITGTNIESGDFGVLLTAANACTSDSRWLAIHVDSSAPSITSGSLVAGVEGQPVSYQITASGNPTSFGATDLPAGVSVNANTGLVDGNPAYAGEFDSTIIAYNPWGTATAKLHFSISHTMIGSLEIANITTNYYSPYLLEFQFTLRDTSDPTKANALALDPALLQVSCYESTNQSNPDPNAMKISPSETAQTIQRGNTKIMKTYLVLDFTASVSDIGLNGDTNGNSISDAVDLELQGALDFVNQQPATAQIGVIEFHRDDFAPQLVQSLTTDKALLRQQINGIWDGYVQGWPAASRVWDATLSAVQALGNPTPDEQHYVVLVSDGKDESSTTALDALIAAATGTNNVHIYCVGFGKDIDEGQPSLTELASATKGQYYEARNASQLASQLAQISKDLQGQYILRWATLRRGGKAFLPSFEITYQGHKATCPVDPVITYTTNYTGTNVDGTTPEFTTNDWGFFDNTNWVVTSTNQEEIKNWTISPYKPDDYAGPVTNGILFLSPNADVHPTGIDLVARYVPRYVRQFNLHYQANWPCTVSLQNTNPGEILFGWTMNQVSDGAGGNWLFLNSSNPASLSSSIPFAAFGRLLTFTFRDAIFTNASAFSFITNDNTIYTNTGKQSFTITNAVQYSNTVAALPMGTPVPWLMYYGVSGNFTNAELTDMDHDGVPAWMEYRAGTNPTNALDKLFIRSLTRSSYDYRYQVTFPSKLNHAYRVESSTDLVSWQLVQDNIPGNGNDVTVSDKALRLGPVAVFYRLSVY